MSPTTQFSGTPALITASPVVLVRSQVVSCARSGAGRALPRTNARRSSASARGVEVSLFSPGTQRLSSGSSRSIRVTSSPSFSSEASRPSGPPTWSKRRLAAVLSLYRTEASHSSFSVMPVSTCFSVTGEWATRSSRV
ncbi:hypothetical protein GA0115255_116531 [Streptomyces sp. Ncost-T6T-2b]|nr:hypothetical protein GA0115255_116531 [Streptomyces sp. Ncost-T6T-2b]